MSSGYSLSPNTSSSTTIHNQHVVCRRYNQDQQHHANYSDDGENDDSSSTCSSKTAIASSAGTTSPLLLDWVNNNNDDDEQESEFHFQFLLPPPPPQSILHQNIEAPSSTASSTRSTSPTTPRRNCSPSPEPHIPENQEEEKEKENMDMVIPKRNDDSTTREVENEKEPACPMTSCLSTTKGKNRRFRLKSFSRPRCWSTVPQSPKARVTATTTSTTAAPASHSASSSSLLSCINRSMAPIQMVLIVLIFIFPYLDDYYFHLNYAQLYNIATTPPSFPPPSIFSKALPVLQHLVAHFQVFTNERFEIFFNGFIVFLFHPTKFFNEMKNNRTFLLVLVPNFFVLGGFVFAVCFTKSMTINSSFAINNNTQNGFDINFEYFGVIVSSSSLPSSQIAALGQDYACDQAVLSIGTGTLNLLCRLWNWRFFSSSSSSSSPGEEVKNLFMKIISEIIAPALIYCIPKVVKALFF